MKIPQIVGIMAMLVVGTQAMAQSYIKLDPAQLPNNIITITPISAGVVPEDPLSGNSNQTLEYKWEQKPYAYRSLPTGYLYVSYYYLHPAFEVYVKADYNEGANHENGVSAGMVKAVWGDFTVIISNVTTNNVVRRVLTQWVKVKDFSQLSIGTYDLTLNYFMSY